MPLPILGSYEWQQMSGPCAQLQQQSNAVHRKQSRARRDSYCIFPLCLCVRETVGIRGKPHVMSARGGTGERIVPVLLRRWRKVRFLHLSWKTGPEGRDGRGRKVPRQSLRETASLQRLVGKPVPDSDGFQEKIGRKCVQCSWIGFVPGAQRVSWTSDFLRPMREKGEWFPDASGL